MLILSASEKSSKELSLKVNVRSRKSQTAREGGKLLPLTRVPELFLETFIVVLIAYSLNILEYVFTRSGFEDL